ncbi:FadR/GntR family transcriptional regulator [Kitasatospora sp. NPDC059327]|uniref:FadR/GntR family transcriptional regulator n=1 Tax=Kitasatospora sp. NPDC059327 TaxID=3346803 RepID=UPI00369BEAEF
MARVDDAVAKIRELVRTGELRPGQRLPPEQELAAQLGMSRNSLREAVKVLEAARVVVVRQGDGTYVTSLSPRILFEGIGVGVELLQGQHLLEVLEVRRMLEPAATAAAALRLTEPGLATVRAHLEAMAETADEAEAMVAHDMAFHRSIVAAAGNEFLVSILDGIAQSTLRVRVWRGLLHSSAAERTLTEHRAIVAALEQRDPLVAHAAATMHIATSVKWLMQSVPSLNGHAPLDESPHPEAAA